jgi:hypothetical protein
MADHPAAISWRLRLVRQRYRPSPRRSPLIGWVTRPLVPGVAQPVRLITKWTNWSHSGLTHWRSRDDDHTIGELATAA